MLNHLFDQLGITFEESPLAQQKKLVTMAMAKTDSRDLFVVKIVNFQIEDLVPLSAITELPILTFEMTNDTHGAPLLNAKYPHDSLKFIVH